MSDFSDGGVEGFAIVKILTMPRLKIRLNAFRRPTIPKNQFHMFYYVGCNPQPSRVLL